MLNVKLESEEVYHSRPLGKIKYSVCSYQFIIWYEAHRASWCSSNYFAVRVHKAAWCPRCKHRHGIALPPWPAQPSLGGFKQTKIGQIQRQWYVQLSNPTLIHRQLTLFRSFKTRKCSLTTVAIRIDRQSYKLCDLILTKGDLHGWRDDLFSKAT